MLPFLNIIYIFLNVYRRSSQVAIVVENLAANSANIRDMGSIPGWEGPWRRAWQPTPVLLPGKSSGQRSLADYNSPGLAQSCMQLSN